MAEVIINENLCVKCNTCVTECALYIIDSADDSRFPATKEEYKNFCILCGHCESFCPQHALTLDYYKDEKITDDPNHEPINPHNLALYLKNRRSIRHYLEQPVSKELIEGLIDIARYAASAGNGQPVKWLVITEPSTVRQIAQHTIEWFQTIRGTTHPFAGYVPILLSKWENGEEVICRNAPHLLFAHLPSDVPIFNPTDAVIAMTHIDIAAPSFGLGTCWAGFVMMALSTYQPLRDLLALPENRRVASAMMLGYPARKPVSIPRRKHADIVWN